MSSVNLDVKLSPKILPLVASPNFHPVNIEDNFKSVNEAVPDKGQVQLDSPLSYASESGKMTVCKIPIGSFPAPNAMYHKYTYAEAWKLEPLVFCQQPKFGAGKDQSFHDHLLPELHCARCSFPELTLQIHICNMSYMNKCTNTSVWIDHDFIVSFVTVLSYFAHSSAQHSSSTPVGDNKALPQIVHVSYCKEQISIHGVKSLPPDVHQLISLLHNSSHYNVLTVDIPGGIFTIFDGLSRDLLQWMDHIVLVLKKCMLLDVSYDSSKTIVMADEATPLVVPHSRRPGKSSNGYSITFPWCQPSDMIFQPW